MGKGGREKLLASGLNERGQSFRKFISIVDEEIETRHPLITPNGPDEVSFDEKLNLRRQRVSFLGIIEDQILSKAA